MINRKNDGLKRPLYIIYIDKEYTYLCIKKCLKTLKNTKRLYFVRKFSFNNKKIENAFFTGFLVKKEVFFKRNFKGLFACKKTRFMV